MLSGKPPFEANRDAGHDDALKMTRYPTLFDSVYLDLTISSSLDDSFGKRSQPALLNLLTNSQQLLKESSTDWRTKNWSAHENQPTVFPAAVPFSSTASCNTLSRFPIRSKQSPLIVPNPVPVPMGDHNTVYDSPRSEHLLSGSNSCHPRPFCA